MAHASLTVSAPMPNRVAHASMCVWPNLTKHKTNPMCLHLLTVFAPLPNHVCTYAYLCGPRKNVWHRQGLTTCQHLPTFGARV